MTPLPYESCEALYDRYKDQHVLLSSEQYARWTVASVFPSTTTQTTGLRYPLERDYQSKGAMLVNNLASKVTQALFPQDNAFFEISPTDEMMRIAQTLGVDSQAASSLFAGIETRASARVFLNAGYSALTYAIKLLVVTGNALLYRDPTTYQFFAYSVRDYVVRRDGSGTVLLTILKERIAVGDLPAEARVNAGLSGKQAYDDVDLYTRIERSRNQEDRVVYTVTQECCGQPVGTASIYPESLCPYIPLTWNLITGEHYGRGLIEDLAGDMARLSELSEASLLYQIEMMRLINIVDPGSGIDLDDVADAETGKFVSGKAGVPGNGVVAHEGGDAQKLQAVNAELQLLMQQLSVAFMYTGNTRDAERVTAEEIRANIAEANQTLGGIYANISEVLHVRLANILTLEEEPSLKSVLRTQGVTLDVSVGLASLNRQSQVEKLQYLSNAIQLVLPQLSQASARFNPDLIIDALCQGYGIDRESLSYTAEQLQQLQQQQQAAAQQSAASMQAGANNATNPQVTQINSDQLGLTGQ